jgi:hypothetical protein
MKNQILEASLLSTAVLLILVPVTQAVPHWMKPHRREYEPRQYSVYEPPPYGGYSYGGYGPLPTIQSSSSSGVSRTSEDSGEATSSSPESSSKSSPNPGAT